MALFRIPEILVVDSIRGAEIWKSWIQNYNIYESASEIEVKSPKIQIATFLNIIGQEGIDIYNSFDDNEIEELIDGKTKKIKGKENLNWIKNKFQEYFIPKRNITYERYTFNIREQQNENIETYYAELKKLAKSCEFGELTNSLIKDRMIIGMKDDALRQRFLQESTDRELSAEKVVEATKIKEISKTQMQHIKHRSTEDVNFVHTKNIEKQHKYSNNYKIDDKVKNSYGNRKCSRCDLKHEPRQCRAYNTKCNLCNKTGHWAKCCRNKKFNVNELTSTKIEKTEFLGEVITSIKDNDWIKNFQIQIGNYNEIVKFKIDTGASVSVIPYTESLPKLEKCNTVLKGANMMNIKVKGCVECNITDKDRTIHETLYVQENQRCGLLSCRASVALGVVRLIGEITERHISGKDNISEDALSRYPNKDVENTILQIEVEEMVSHSFLPGESAKINMIRNMQEKDNEIMRIKEYINQGWTNKNSWKKDTEKYYNSQQYLSINKGCLTYQNRAVIPEINRNEIIEDIHTGHLGITKCLERAKNSVHWFGISRNIERKVRDCNQCRVSNKTYREPIQLVPVPSKSWETVGTDLYQFKQSKYVVVVDYYSRYQRGVGGVVVNHILCLLLPSIHNKG